MAATVFVPLTGRLIDEGTFLDDLDQELRELQRALVNYRHTYGEKSKGAVAKLKIEIAIGIANPDDDAYIVKAGMKAEHPKRPATVSLAMGGVDDDGKLALFVRKSGSDDAHPRQLKLATKDGKVINQETGEVLDE